MRDGNHKGYFVHKNHVYSNGDLCVWWYYLPPKGNCGSNNSHGISLYKLRLGTNTY